ILARKPAKRATPLNIDECRIESERPTGWAAGPSSGYSGGLDSREPDGRPVTGRYPANVVLDEDAAAALDAQSGTLTSGANPTARGTDKFRGVYQSFEGQRECIPARGADSGGASRFFYCAKASRSEREAG